MSEDFAAVRSRLTRGAKAGMCDRRDIALVLAEVDRLTSELEALTMAFLTPSEVAKRLRVSKMTVYREIERGELPAIRIGHLYRIPAPGVDAYLADRAVADHA